MTVEGYYWFRSAGVEIDGLHVTADEFEVLDILGSCDSSVADLNADLEHGRHTLHRELRSLEAKGMVKPTGELGRWRSPIWELTARGAIPFGGPGVIEEMPCL